MELPWTEKYRPRTLGELRGHKEIIERLKAYVNKKSMPHLIFAGPAGTGKTASSLALARDLFGENFNQNFLELNASDERGIDVVRTRIKDFASIMPYGDYKFKIIFLDESDALTRDAQNALRRTMEKFTGTCRFIMSANYSSKLIEPIQSRCAVFRFKPLPEKEIVDFLGHIATAEKLNVDKMAYAALVYASEGDMRKSINFLQTSAATTDNITEDVVYKTAARARPKEIEQLVELALSGNFEDARKNLDALLFEYAMSGEEVILQVYKSVSASDKLDERKKIEIIDRIGEYNFRLTEGANERIQLDSLLAYLVLAGKK
ncbi:MAG: replication factor C small subunit [DPANN group archaeon]|nr:replication factor C small subunit [DPANN group archaeon]